MNNQIVRLRAPRKQFSLPRFASQFCHVLAMKRDAALIACPAKDLTR